MTRADFSGNLGGVAGADQKCAKEYPGFKFGKWDYVKTVSPNTVGFGDNFSGTIHGAWMVSASTPNCSGWTTDTNDSTDATKGTILSGQGDRTKGTQKLANGTATCNVWVPVVCCNH